MNRKNTFYFSIGLILIINIITNHFSFNIDLTEDKRYTLSNDSKSILNDIDDNLSIKVYLEGDLPAGFELLSNAIMIFLLVVRKKIILLILSLLIQILMI